MKIHFLQHVEFEGPGSIEDWINRKGHQISITRLYDNEKLPEIKEIEWLIIMGVYDENRYPWLQIEKKFIKKAIQNGKVLIGICLGAQLIADALGAKVYKNRYKEIGWYPIKFSRNAGKLKPFDFFPDKLVVFHWHGDTFDLPEGSTLLATSDACENQAFVFNNRVFGFQFHLEVTEEGACELIKYCGHEITGEKYMQLPEEILSDKSKFKKIKRIMDKFLYKLDRDRSSFLS